MNKAKLTAASGSIDPATSGVTDLAYVNGGMWQKNTAQNWYQYTGGPGPYKPGAYGPATALSPMASATGAGGGFYTSAGQIVSPEGKVWICRGMDLYDGQASQIDGQGKPITSLFPGVNFIRLACYSNNYAFKSASSYSTFINTMTAMKIVVLLEHHEGAGGGSIVPSGNAAAAELAWFTDIATTYKNNPYVWFGTLNEPSGDTGGDAAITANQVNVYNAARATGSSSLVVFQFNSGGPGKNANYPAAPYASMHNTVWDIHYYNWTSGYSNNQGTVTNTLKGTIADTFKFPNADGQMPVIIGEFGPSTSGSVDDPGGTQVLVAAEQSETFGSSGGSAWSFQSNAPTDNLTDYNYNRTAFGNHVAAWIASPQPNTTPVAPRAALTAASTESPSGTTIPPATSLTDHAGHVWTLLASGQAAIDGNADATTAGVVTLAYSAGLVWQKNKSNLWWHKAKPSDAWVGSATGPAVTVPPASSITDASGNVWSISTGQQIQVVAVAPPTVTLAVSVSKGSVSMTSGGKPVSGSGTTTISMTDTLANLRTALATLTLG